MTVTNSVLKAYTNPLVTGRTQAPTVTPGRETPSSFSDTLRESLKKVNDMQSEKNAMITEFAAGEHQNVHELMITMQKASMAMKMTSTIRSKVMESYKEIMHMQF
ncbi:MAG: flagellar hook-basal body complex protein FliE [Deltaproteobacteria bacterium]|nr:flagellar hook-basal body complex protein FliE [Deltaproteobacteria bacterium]